MESIKEDIKLELQRLRLDKKHLYTTLLRVIDVLHPDTPGVIEVPEETPEVPVVVEETPEVPVVVEETPEVPVVVEETPEVVEVVEETPETPEVVEETHEVPTITENNNMVLDFPEVAQTPKKSTKKKKVTMSV
jgi:hypothetical protein